MNSKLQQHNDRTRLNALNPKLVGLDDVLMSTDGANIFSSPSGVICRQPDNLYFCEDFKLFADEYKCGRGQTGKATKQLHDYKGLLSELFPNWDVVVRYVYGNNVIKVLK